MRTVDLIHQKRDGEELSPEEIASLVDGYLSGEIPDYQMSAFLMATYFSGMSDREVSAMTERMIASGHTPAWATVVLVTAGLCCFFQALTSYYKGNDGLSQHRQ